MLSKIDLAAYNLAQQCRLAPMTEWEKELGDALERIFGKGIETLSEIVAELNAMRVFAQNGKPWTEESFRAAMAQMGA
jgi:hypothetical protein